MIYLSEFNVFLLEGLSKDQEDFFMEDWDENRLEDWFGKNNHRIYLPLKKRVGEGDVEEFINDGEPSVESQIELYLQKTYGFQYEIEDYVKGYAVDHKNKDRIIKLGKILKDRYLLQAFNDDSIRAGNRASKRDPIICLSKHPLDIASMSTGRGWKSCKELPNEGNPNGGIKHKFLKEEVKILLIAYLIYPDDKKIEHPIARVNLLPYYNERGQTYYRLHHITYGSPGVLLDNFYDTLRAWFDEKQRDLINSKDTFTLDKKVYADGARNKIHLDPENPTGNENKKVFENREYEVWFIESIDSMGELPFNFEGGGFLDERVYWINKESIYFVFAKENPKTLEYLVIIDQPNARRPSFVYKDDPEGSGTIALEEMIKIIGAPEQIFQYIRNT